MRDVSLSTLVLPHASSSSWTGRDGADVAEASSVCISLDRSAPGSPGESSPGPGSTTFFALRWPGRVWLPDIISLLDGPPPELPVRRDLNCMFFCASATKPETSVKPEYGLP